MKTELLIDSVETCCNCNKIFKKDSIIIAAFGLLFCSTKCTQQHLPEVDLDYVEEVLASDIGVK